MEKVEKELFLYFFAFDSTFCSITSRFPLYAVYFAVIEKIRATLLRVALYVSQDNGGYAERCHVQYTSWQTGCRIRYRELRCQGCQ